MKQIKMIKEMAAQGHTAKEIQNALEIQFGKEAFKHTAIYKYINEQRFGAPDIKEEDKPDYGYDFELQNTIQREINEFPFSSVRSIADNINCPPSTVYRYLTVYMGLVFKHTRWVPHKLTIEQSQIRVKESGLLAETLIRSKHYSFHNILTGDQSWFYFNYGADGAWLPEDEDNPEYERSKIQLEKMMLTIIWNPYDFYIVDFLPEGTSFNSTYFIDNILNPLNEQRLNIWHESDQRNIILHLDNCRVHNSKVSMKKINELGFSRAPHPPYSPDLAPSDFYLFGYIKNRLKGKRFKSRDDLKEEIFEILRSISIEKRKSVFEEWIHRCQWVSTNDGRYYKE